MHTACLPNEIQAFRAVINSLLAAAFMQLVVHGPLFELVDSLISSTSVPLTVEIPFALNERCHMFSINSTIDGWFTFHFHASPRPCSNGLIKQNQPQVFIHHSTFPIAFHSWPSRKHKLGADATAYTRVLAPYESMLTPLCAFSCPFHTSSRTNSPHLWMEASHWCRNPISIAGFTVACFL